VDHVLPVALGGHDTVDNLVTSCYACNRGRGDTLRMRTKITTPRPYSEHRVVGLLNDTPQGIRALAEATGMKHDSLYRALRRSSEAEQVNANQGIESQWRRRSA
jgi:hypothetical protein